MRYNLIIILGIGIISTFALREVTRIENIVRFRTCVVESHGTVLLNCRDRILPIRSNTFSPEMDISIVQKGKELTCEWTAAVSLINEVPVPGTLSCRAPRVLTRKTRGPDADARAFNYLSHLEALFFDGRINLFHTCVDFCIG
jgi:hypothetical protein